MATSRCPGVTTIVRMRTPGAEKNIACDINVQIPEGGVQRYALPEWFRQRGSSNSFRSILIESSCPIDVAGYNADRFSNDAFMVLPATMLGKCRNFRNYKDLTFCQEFHSHQLYLSLISTLLKWKHGNLHL